MLLHKDSKTLINSITEHSSQSKQAKATTKSQKAIGIGKYIGEKDFKYKCREISWYDDIINDFLSLLLVYCIAGKGYLLLLRFSDLLQR